MARRLLYCHCAYSKVIPDGVKRAALEALCASGAPFEATADLCELAARKDKDIENLAALEDITVIACRERAVRALAEAAGAKLSEKARVLDMKALSPDQAAQAVRDLKEVAK